MVGPVGLVGLLQDLKTMAGTDAISKEELEALKKQWLEEMKANMKVTTHKFVDSYTLNLDPDPEFWTKFGSRVMLTISKEKFKIILEK